MEIKIKITRASTTPTLPGLFRVRKWVIPEDGMDTAKEGFSSFQEVPLFTPAGGFGAITQFQRLTAIEEACLRSMQIENDGWGFTVTQKMGWLISSINGEREYWRKDGVLVFGTMVNGGQIIQVETDIYNKPVEYVFKANYRNDPVAMGKHDITFYKLLGLRRSQVADVGAKIINYETHPHLVHRCTVAWYPDNRYTDHTPKGIVYTPVWSPLDYPPNTGGNALFIARVFLEST
jgi:hypothetical protein